MDESDIGQLEITLAATKKAGKTYIKTILIKFLFRWVLFMLFLLSILYFIPFLKYFLPIIGILIIYSLYNIYLQNRQFNLKIKEIESLIKEIKGKN